MSGLLRKSYSFGALAYDSAAAALAAQRALRLLEQEDALELKDDAIVRKTSDGRLGLDHGTHMSPKTGMVMGGTVGLLLGLAVGGPIAGVALGAAASQASSALGTSITTKRLEQLGEALEPGQAALCVLIEKANWELLKARLEPLGGTLLEAQLTDEALEALEQARTAEQDHTSSEQDHTS